MRSSKVNWNNTQLYGILDTGYLPEANFGKMALQLIEGGVSVLQVRAKGASSQKISELAMQVYDICKQHQVPLIINDAIDAAKEIPLAGLHIGQDDIAPEQARAILGVDRIIGLSTHSRTQVLDAVSQFEHGSIDYFAVGPVFKTNTKPDYTAVTLELVEWVIAQKIDIPHFFIGGINENSLPQLVHSGARKIVVVSDLLLAEEPTQKAQRFISRLNQP